MGKFNNKNGEKKKKERLTVTGTAAPRTWGRKDQGHNAYFLGVSTGENSLLEKFKKTQDRVKTQRTRGRFERKRERSGEGAYWLFEVDSGEWETFSPLGIKRKKKILNPRERESVGTRINLIKGRGEVMGRGWGTRKLARLKPTGAKKASRK